MVRSFQTRDFPAVAGRALGLSGAALLLALAAGCAERPAAPGPEGAGTPGAAGPEDTRVIGATGLNSDVPSFTVRRQGRLIQVEFYNAGGGVRQIMVSAPGGRGLDRGDARPAYDAAFAAAQQFDCGGGQPMVVDADSAFYQEEGRRTALTQGAPTWIFRGRCG